MGVPGENYYRNQENKRRSTPTVGGGTGGGLFIVFLIFVGLGLNKALGPENFKLCIFAMIASGLVSVGLGYLYATVSIRHHEQEFLSKPHGRMLVSPMTWHRSEEGQKTNEIIWKKTFVLTPIVFITLSAISVLFILY